MSRLSRPQHLVAVGGDAAVLLHLGGHALADVVSQRGEHEGQRPYAPVPQLCGLVQHQHGMLEHVALGVEFGILLKAYSLLHLGEEFLQVVHGLQLAEIDGGPLRLHQGLFRLGK